MTFIPKKGDRVELVAMPNDPDPIKAGTQGLVTDVRAMHWPATDWHQVFVQWDDGRSLACVTPPDVLKLVQTS